MVLSGELFRIQYTFFWHLAQWLFRPDQIVFYCPEMIDYYSFAPVLKHLPPIKIASNSAEVRRQLAPKGIAVKRLPAFPRCVVMCRHATHRFPCSSIVKVGLRHGAYHFKRLTRADNYNRFDLYLFTSQSDLEAALDIGVKVGQAVGFPRLDPAFDGSITKDTLDALSADLKLDPSKSTLLFTATWDKSGMSGIVLWHDRLCELASKHNILVTAHPWTDKRFLTKVKAAPGVRFLKTTDLTPYIMLADIVIGDTSSLLADCSALGKQIIRFRTGKARRSLEEIDTLLDMMSVSISTFEELPPAIDRLCKNPEQLKGGQAKANAVMFDILDGKAGKRAADAITELLQERKIWP